MDKHDQLTENEINLYQLKQYLLDALDKYKDSIGIENNSKLKILDWGCGRGRSVLKLLKLGYDAYGMDIDESVLLNGNALFTKLGYLPQQRLVTYERLLEFPDNFFDVIFSEQVIEHMEDLEGVAKQMSRLTKSNGLGFHVFPGSRNVKEVHLHIPLIHWLPKNQLRLAPLFLNVFLGNYPKWPQTRNKSLLEKVMLFYNYLDKKTYYRDYNKIEKIFESEGFNANCYNKRSRRKFVPKALHRNAFPKGSLRLSLVR